MGGWTKPTILDRESQRDRAIAAAETLGLAGNTHTCPSAKSLVSNGENEIYQYCSEKQSSESKNRISDREMTSGPEQGRHGQRYYDNDRQPTPGSSFAARCALAVVVLLITRSGQEGRFKVALCKDLEVDTSAVPGMQFTPWPSCGQPHYSSLQAAVE